MKETEPAHDAPPAEDPEAPAQQHRPPSVDDVLHEAVQKIVLAVPSERSLVFLYEKATNRLSVHSTSDEHDDRVNFPPVMGMISACFLHKRCQRMQQPHQHRALHREYDVPSDMQMDSILCAPIILHHRVIGVIELINRLDPDAASDANTNPRAVTSRQIQSSSEDGVEVRLHRSNTMKPQAKMGFSLKDEQKLMQFASHVGQSIVTTLKEIASGETQAELRDNHTQSALELLSMLNEKLEYHPNESPEPVSRPVWKSSAPKPVSSQGNAYVELISDPVIYVSTLARLVKVQAIFRGRQERSRQELPVMIQHSRETKRLREENSATVVQTAVRRCNKRKQYIKERKAIKIIESVYAHYRFRLKLDKQRHTKRRVTKKPSVMQTTAAKRKNIAMPETHEIQTFRARSASAETIQKHFRGHQTRKMVKKMTGLSNLGKGLRNIIKLQAFFRGSATRKRVQKLLKEKRSVRLPTTVCVRIGADSNQQSHDECARSCVYPLPDRQSRAHLIINRYDATRHRLEELFDSARTLSLNCTHQSGSAGESISTRGWKSSKCASSSMNDSCISAESRRLLPSFETVPVFNRVRNRVCNSSTFTSVGTLAKAFPTYAFDPERKKGKERSPGVEFASELLMKTPGRAKTSQSSRGNTSVQAGNKCSLSVVKNVALVNSSEDYRNYAFAAAIGMQDGRTLPSLRPQVIQTRGKRSQISTNPLWCFVPATDNSNVKQRHESIIAISVTPAQHPQTRSMIPRQPGLSLDKTQAYSRNRHLVVPESCSRAPD